MKLLLIISLVVCSTFGFASAQTSALNVRLVTDEAEAVLALLAKRKVNQPITDQDWQRVFQSEGYTRLKQREAAMQRSFDDVLESKLTDEQIQQTGYSFFGTQGRVHSRLEDVCADREKLRAIKVDRMFLRSTKTLFHLQLSSGETQSQFPRAPRIMVQLTCERSSMKIRK